MGQQMTPVTAKVKCKNFLATLLRLASDQPEGVARNVRALIQVSHIFDTILIIYFLLIYLFIFCIYYVFYNTYKKTRPPLLPYLWVRIQY